MPAATNRGTKDIFVLPADLRTHSCITHLPSGDVDSTLPAVSSEGDTPVLIVSTISIRQRTLGAHRPVAKWVSPPQAATRMNVAVRICMTTVHMPRFKTPGAINWLSSLIAVNAPKSQKRAAEQDTKLTNKAMTAKKQGANFLRNSLYQCGPKHGHAPRTRAMHTSRRF